MPQFMERVANMSQEEKFRAIDVLWSSIVSSSDAYEPPAWHEAVLRERRRRVVEGEETFIPWEEAKRQLQEEFA